MSRSEENDAAHTMTKLAMAANHYTHSSPANARFYMYEMNNIRTFLGRAPVEAEQVTCPYCSTIFRPGNYRVTLKPKMKLTKKIERLRRKQDAGKVLGRIQIKMLDLYERSHNKLVLHCENCGKDDTLKGGTRHEPIRVHISADKLREKHREEQKKNPQEKRSKLPKMTAAIRKRLKKREKRRERCSYEDSGLPASLLTSASRVTSSSDSLSTISFMDGLNSSLMSESSARLSSRSSPSTSTPMVKQRSPRVMGEQPPSDDFTTFLKSIKMSSDKYQASSKKDNTKKKGKKKSGMGKLQGLLMQQKQQENNRRNESTLINFLSSV